ncbi:MAG: DUF4003 family protein [Clostridium sp.]
MKELINLMIVNSDRLEGVKGTYGIGLLRKCNALTLTLRNQVADPIRINECRDIIKNNTKMFSTFRGNCLVTTAVNISLEENPKEAFREIQNIYEKLKMHFSGSEYLVLASNVIFKARFDFNIDEIVLRTKEAYDIMKNHHRFLTSSEDIVTAAMIATNSSDFDKTFKEIEECYEILRESGFWSGDNLQTLAHILSLVDGTAKEKCEKVVKLNSYLLNEGVPLKGYALPLLGVSLYVTEDFKDFSTKLLEIDNFLKTQKGFGSFTLGKNERRMISAGLACSTYFKDINKEVNNQIINTTSNITLTVIMAMEMACAAAACAAATASSSS